MKTKTHVRIGAASILFSPKRSKTGLGWDAFFDFCDTYLPGCGCDIVLLPEFCGGHQDDSEAVGKGPISKAFAAIAREHRLYLFAPLYEKKDKKEYNTMVLYSPKGDVLYTYQKVHLAPSEKGKRTAGHGFRIVTLPWFQAGVMTCFDNQFPESSRILALLGADIIFYPSFGDLKKPHRDAARCLDNHIYLVGASVIDTACGLSAKAFEQGMVMDPQANLLAHTGPKAGLAVAELPLHKGKLVTKKDAGNSIGFKVDYLRCRRPDTYATLLS